MQKACVLTLGCKVNQYESDCLVFALKKAGFEVSTKLASADFYIINSCAVTNEAEHKSREQISKIIKLNPNAKIYVCGCSSQLHASDYLNKTNVEAAIGTENKLSLVDAIINNKKLTKPEPLSCQYNDSYFAEPTKTRSTIKIQDGCNCFCSYCIIPYTRGRERSRTLQSIKNEVAHQTKISKEIVLVGINIAGYGKDLSPKKSLTDVAKIFRKFPETRLRFSSWEMGTINESLLKELSTLPNFCPFFHISLQSANDEVLKKMNRHYTFKDYKNVINSIYKYFPEAAISTDVIVGFPTETEEQFINSLENIKSIEFANMHIFPYSRREGTVAAKYKQINGTVIKERIKKLSEIANTHKTNYLNKFISKPTDVLIEETKAGYYCGFTKNYIKTYVPDSASLQLNCVYKIKLIKPFKDGMIGELYE